MMMILSQEIWLRNQGFVEQKVCSNLSLYIYTIYTYSCHISRLANRQTPMHAYTSSTRCHFVSGFDGNVCNFVLLFLFGNLCCLMTDVRVDT